MRLSVKSVAQVTPGRGHATGQQGEQSHTRRSSSSVPAAFVCCERGVNDMVLLRGGSKQVKSFIKALHFMASKRKFSRGADERSFFNQHLARRPCMPAPASTHDQSSPYISVDAVLQSTPSPRNQSTCPHNYLQKLDVFSFCAA